jgi:hypothetical protein
MHAANSPVAITGCGPPHVKLPELIGNNGVSISKWMRDGVSITACGYHKSVVYYSRTLAYFNRRDMLFSGGDFPRTLSSILSGEGFDEKKQGKSPLEIPDSLPPSLFLRRHCLHHLKPRINSQTFEK